MKGGRIGNVPAEREARLKRFLTDFGQQGQGENDTQDNDDEKQPAIFIPGFSERQNGGGGHK